MNTFQRRYFPGALCALLALAAGAVPAAADLRPVYEGAPDETVSAIVVDDGELRVYRSDRERADEAASPAALAARGGALGASQIVVTSEDGTQSGLVSYGLSPAGGMTASFELLRDGRPAWRIESPGPVNFAISNDGSTVAAAVQDIDDPRRGGITLYGRDGRELARIEQLLIRQVRLAADGGRIAANTWRDGIVVFGRGGERLYSLPGSTDFRLSADGRSLAAFAADEVVIYRDGKIEARLPTDGVARDAALTPDGGLLAAVDRKNLYLYDVSAGDLRFTKSAADRRREFRAVALTADGGALLAGQLQVFERRNRKRAGRAEAEVLLLDRDGAVLKSEQFRPQSWNRSTPSVRFVAEGDEALVMSRNAVYLLDTRVD